MAKRFDRKAKERRQKIVAGVGALILVAVLAIQVPRTMRMLNQEPPQPSSAAATSPSAVPSDPSILPTPGTVGGETPQAAPGELVDSDPAPAPEAGQLVAFGRFTSKDPFVQQITEGQQAGGTGGGTSEQPAEGAEGEGGPTGGTTGGAPAKAPAGAATSAVISVNGVEETVAVRDEFPKDEPVFRLASLSRTEAKIGIAGGSLASGQPTVTLKLGQTLTLVNTADGMRYELKLVSTG